MTISIDAIIAMVRRVDRLKAELAEAERELKALGQGTTTHRAATTKPKAKAKPKTTHLAPSTTGKGAPLTRRVYETLFKMSEANAGQVATALKLPKGAKSNDRVKRALGNLFDAKLIERVSEGVYTQTNRTPPWIEKKAK